MPFKKGFKSARLHFLFQLKKFADKNKRVIYFTITAFLVNNFNKDTRENLNSPSPLRNTKTVK
jgi:hypothetical protein